MPKIIYTKRERCLYYAYNEREGIAILRPVGSRLLTPSGHMKIADGDQSPCKNNCGWVPTSGSTNTKNNLGDSGSNFTNGYKKKGSGTSPHIGSPLIPEPTPSLNPSFGTVSDNNVLDDPNGLSNGQKIGKAFTTATTEIFIVIPGEFGLLAISTIAILEGGPAGIFVDLALAPVEVAVADFGISLALNTYQSIKNDRVESFWKTNRTIRCESCLLHE